MTVGAPVGLCDGTAGTFTDGRASREPVTAGVKGGVCKVL